MQFSQRNQQPPVMVTSDRSQNGRPTIVQESPGCGARIVAFVRTTKRSRLVGSIVWALAFAVLLGCSTAESRNADESDMAEPGRDRPIQAAVNESEAISPSTSSPSTERQPERPIDLADSAQPSGTTDPRGANDPETRELEEDWPLFRGDAHGTGVARTSLPEAIDVVWQYVIPQGSFEGTPTIVDRDNPRVYIGDLDGRLLALELRTGELVWETQLESKLGFVTAPAIRDGRIYIGDIDGIFHCFDRTGKEQWKFTTDAEIDSSANFYRDRVLFGSQDTNLYALDAESGELQWRVETADQVRCSATVIENRGFVAGCDGALHVIDLDEGKETGAAPINSPTGVTPAARDDFVFVGTEQAGFYCINWRTTEIVWQFDDPEGGLSTRSSPALKGNQVVFGASNRRVYSLDTSSGEVQWTTLLKAKVESSPIIVDDRVLVGSSDGRFYMLELATGKILWQKQLNGGILGSPAAAYGHVVVATQRGVVYCLGKKTDQGDPPADGRDPTDSQTSKNHDK